MIRSAVDDPRQNVGHVARVHLHGVRRVRPARCLKRNFVFILMFGYRALVDLPQINKSGKAQTKLSLMFLCNQKRSARLSQPVRRTRQAQNVHALTHL